MKFINYFKISKAYLRYKLKKYIPFAIYLAVTDKCFLKCEHCYIPSKKKFSKDISTKQIFNLIEDAKRIGIPYFNLWGGEPLLRKDIFRIGKKLKKSRIISSITTNGQLITKDKAKKLNESFNIVKVSFKGLEKSHDNITNVKGSYKKTLEGLKNLINTKNRKCQIIINFVVNEKNYKDISQFVKEHSRCTDLISFLPENRIIKKKVFSNKEFIREWSNISQEYPIADFNTFIKNISADTINCDAGKLYYGIYSSGDVYVCDVRREIKLGNMKQERFYKIWKKGLNENVKNKIKKCPGCYMKSTKEVSQLFRMSPLELIINIPKIVQTYRLRQIK